jgi:NAD(P)-dependent dehydrogenase (short-subunit alcohol dehydrogenase family)
MATVLITGCSTGIGYATALRLAADGWNVVATMRDPERDGDRLRDEAADAGTDVRVLALDVTDPASVQAAFEQAGELDALVNNAAIMAFGSVEETDIETWQALFDTNLYGAVRCFRAAAPKLRARGGGCVVNVSSAAGRVSLGGVGAYAASKAALESISETMAIEGHAHGIRVVIIETGATATAMGAKVTRPSRDSIYWGPIRNTLAFLAAQAPGSPAMDVAGAIALALRDPATPLRVESASGSADLIRARSTMTDNDWIVTAAAPTDAFVERYHAATGISLRS